MNRLMALGKKHAERRAREKAAELAAKMRAELPRGIAAEAVEEGVRLSGRGIARRFALDAGLRWLAGRVR